jgi:membrane-associated phospholipid phosphatase
MIEIVQTIFYKFWKNTTEIFRGRNLLYHLIAIVITYLLVIFNIDWKYFEFFHGTIIYNIAFSASLVGMFVPIIAPMVLLVYGKVKENFKLINTGFALTQAGILGVLVSFFYKALTGRAHPQINAMLSVKLENITHVFNFGFFREGVFWGWPSSHTMVAFAMTFTLLTLYPKNKYVRVISLIYAFYIGIGVSMTIHWFSDFVAGAIFGALIGTIIGRAFSKRVS